MIISLLLPLLLVRKRKNIRSSFETRSLGKLVKMMIRWLTDFLCVWVVSFKTIFEKKKESGPFGFPPHRSAEFVLLKIRASATKETSDHWEEVWNKKNIFFFEKNWNPRLLSHSGVVVMFFPRREISGSKTQPQQKKNNKSRKKIFCQYFWNFLVSEPPEYFFFLVTNENFYLSLSVCVCVSWKRKNFLAVFVVFRRHLLEELAVKYVWTQNWIILDATIFGLDKTCRESICESLTFAHSKKKYLPTNEIETFQEPEVGQKKKTKFEIIWKNFEKKWICAGKRKMSPRTGKKMRKIRRENWEFFFLCCGNEKRRKEICIREKKKMSGFYWVFVHPSLLRWRVFARKLTMAGSKKTFCGNKEFCEKEEEEKKKEITTLPYLNVTSRIVYV